MKITFIYTLADESGVRYVGKSDNPFVRLRYHKKECKKLRTHKEKWLFSTISNGGIIKLEILDEVSINDWISTEIYWIGQLKTWGFNLVNGTDWGEGSNGFKNKKHSLITIEKCRVAAKTLVLSKEARLKISNSNRTRVISDKAKANMSNSAMSRIRLNTSDSIKNKIKMVPLQEMV